METGATGGFSVNALVLRLRPARVPQSSISRALTGATSALHGATYLALRLAPLGFMTMQRLISNPNELNSWIELLDLALAPPRLPFRLQPDSIDFRELTPREFASLEKARRNEGLFKLEKSGLVKLPENVAVNTLPLASDVITAPWHQDTETGTMRFYAWKLPRGSTKRPK